MFTYCIHTTKYSGSRETLVNMINDSGAGWQFKNKIKLAGKELRMY